MGDEEDEVEEGAPAWMATYADLATLMLCFFILLLSFANVDVQNFRMALGSVREAFGVQFEHPGDIQGMTTSVVELSKQESTNRLQVLETQLIQRVRSLVNDMGLQEEVAVFQDERGVVVRLNGAILFRPGSSELAPSAAPLMLGAAAICNAMPFEVWVEGHSDNEPIRTKRFPSNWELSAARATTVMRTLVTAGGLDRSRFRVSGYADTRPVESNDTAQGRAANRRVELLFVRPPPPKADPEAPSITAEAGSPASSDDAMHATKLDRAPAEDARLEDPTTGSEIQ